MNLKQLEYFVHVAELGGFSKAALILNIAQPALSRQIRLLETDLRVSLLLRNGRGVVLTEAGKRLFDHSVGILQLVSRAREDIQANRGASLPDASWLACRRASDECLRFPWSRAFAALCPRRAWRS